jgi:hypothetical protein
MHKHSGNSNECVLSDQLFEYEYLKRNAATYCNETAARQTFNKAWSSLTQQLVLIRTAVAYSDHERTMYTILLTETTTAPTAHY